MKAGLAGFPSAMCSGWPKYPLAAAVPHSKCCVLLIHLEPVTGQTSEKPGDHVLRSKHRLGFAFQETN
ncbi:Hypothetical predicted protein [Podarcis lilfordi]|uniref:Uncharacterized protein n=1 Tax=Podarcis lilfordi TaxID=74358 RepID=A0AA35KRJ9_9SAUR|nr:Hypothetical predicted protein [Podarcis lilfordi]